MPLLHTLRFSHGAQTQTQTPLCNLESLLDLVLTPPTHQPPLSLTLKLTRLFPALGLCMCCFPVENTVFPEVYMIGLFPWNQVVSPIKDQSLVCVKEGPPALLVFSATVPVTSICHNCHFFLYAFPCLSSDKEAFEGRRLSYLLLCLRERRSV